MADRDAAGASATISRARYGDPARFEAEREGVLRCGWLVAARSEQLAAPGDYLVWERFGESVLVTRRADGDLGAFHNVCRHRGARIACESGHARSGLITCPWHGFKYDLDGVVRVVPSQGDFDAKSLNDLAATPVSVVEWEGWIWLSLADSPEPLSEYLGEIGVDLQKYNMSSTRVVGHESWTVNADWKTVCDGFNEAYHVPVLHRGSGGGELVAGQTWLTSLPPHSMMVVPLRQTFEDLQQDGDHHRTSDCHYLAFPATFFNCLPAYIQVFTALPIDATTSVLEVWMVAQADDRAGAAERALAQWQLFRQVVEEDVFVAGEVGAVRRSSSKEDNIINRREARIQWFHDEIDKRIAPFLSGTALPKAIDSNRGA